MEESEEFASRNDSSCGPFRQTRHPARRLECVPVRVLTPDRAAGRPLGDGGQHFWPLTASG